MLGTEKKKTVQEGLYAVAFSIIIASLIISFSILYAGGMIAGKGLNMTAADDSLEETTGDQQPQPLAGGNGDSGTQINTEGDPYMGSGDAQVTMVLFSEFQCPFSGRFARDTLPQIKENYIDTGKVKLYYKDFVVHSTSQRAQEAAACANEQGKFWEYHDLLYNNQGSLDDDSLKSYASELGLNTASFNDCFDSRKYKSQVERDTSDGRSAGATGTPTFFINGEKFVGAQPYSSFKTKIDAALSA